MGEMYVKMFFDIYQTKDPGTIKQSLIVRWLCKKN